jgi:UDP-N-acetylmuramoyl-tripeptide--D-alanyl-D-alanine ligase
MTVALTLQEAATVMHGTLHGADTTFKGVSTDSRQLVAGQLFVALEGPNFDGHTFLPKARENGAVAAVVSRLTDSALPQILVQDTRQALLQLATHWRRSFSIPVVAVTGSNGKTTVKEMLASIFAQAFGGSQYVLATQGNLNNEIGVPLTLFQLDTHHRAAIIEEGASRAGDIAYLTRGVQPDIALVTNAAGAHLEGFGSIATVARTKGEIFEYLRPEGTAIINADDAHAALWRGLCGGRRIIRFGLAHEAEVSAQPGTDNRQRIITPQGEIEPALSLAGRHNLMNALSATAVALAAGIELPQIKLGLETVAPVPGRLQRKPGINGAQIIDDTYNANPASLLAALDVLAACDGDRYLALGDMAELGDKADDYHQQAGRQAKNAGVHRLYAVGNQARLAAQAFGDHGRHFPEQAQLIAALQQDLHAKVTLLVKGSRSAHMDKVVEALVEDKIAVGGGA